MSFIELVSQLHTPTLLPTVASLLDCGSLVVPASSPGCEAASSRVPFSKHPGYNPSYLLLKSQLSQSSNQVPPCSKIFNSSPFPGDQIQVPQPGI